MAGHSGPESQHVALHTSSVWMNADTSTKNSGEAPNQAKTFWSFAEKTCDAKHGASVRYFVSKNSLFTPKRNSKCSSVYPDIEFLFSLKQNSILPPPPRPQNRITFWGKTQCTQAGKCNVVMRKTSEYHEIAVLVTKCDSVMNICCKISWLPFLNLKTWIC